MATDADPMIRYFQVRDGHGRGQLLHDAAYRLVRAALAKHDFHGFDQVMSFCEDPENLRPWLPSDPDRMLFVQGLRQGLHDENSDMPFPSDDSAARAADDWCGLSGMLEVTSSNGHSGLGRGRVGPPIVTD